MKLIKFIILIGVFSSLTACEGFLEEDPKSLISTNTFYNTVGDATKALYGVYNYLGPAYQSLGVGLVSDLAADVLTRGAGAGGSQALPFDNFSFDASSGVLEDLFLTHYNLISSANMLLFRVENADLSGGEGLNAVIGETKFLRALAYFNLVRLFGDVPLRTEPATSTQGLDISRTSAAQVYEQILTDLNDAVGLLNESSPEPGRVNLLAANTLLGKVHLTLGNYNEAVATLEEVIEKRSLYENYGDNFLIANENNTLESIFEVQYGLRPENSNIIQFLTPDNVPGHGFVYGVFKANEDFVSTFEENDARKVVTFWDNNEGDEFGGTFVRKFNDGLLPGVQATDAGQINYPLMRYPDVLLMYAEALNAANNGPTPAAYDAVDQVRNRAGLDDLPEGLNQQTFLEAVLEERKKEFVGEGHRWFDLQRNDMLAEKLAEQGFVAGKHERWPIPQAAIDANANLTQNDGY